MGSVLVEPLGQIVFIRENKLSNRNLLESRHIKRERASLPVDVRRSKTSLLNPYQSPGSLRQVYWENYDYRKEVT